MKILITGVAGFIGSHVCLSLLERGDDVVGLDNLNDYYSVALKEARLKRIEDFCQSRVTSKKTCGEFQPGDVPDTYADVQALVDDIAYQPSTSIEEGIGRFVEWYLGYFNELMEALIKLHLSFRACTLSCHFEPREGEKSAVGVPLTRFRHTGNRVAVIRYP